MHFFPALVCLLLLPAPLIAQQEPPAPLLAGETIQDAIVVPIAQFVGHGWQPIPTDSSGFPGFSLPYRWYQPTAGGRSLAFNEITTVKVRVGMEDEDPSWVVGQLIVADSESLGDKRLPFQGSVLVDSVLPGGVFVVDSSAETRTRLLSLLKRVFPDSFAVPDFTHRKDLLRGSAPVGRVTVQRLSPAGRGNAALMLVEAERCIQVIVPNECADSQLLDLWLLDRGSSYEVLHQRGPVRSDTDFKSGSGLRARAWLDIERRRFVLVDCRGYTGSGVFFVEVLPTGVHQVYPKGPEC